MDEHRRLMRIVEGAVLDAFRNHPDYLTDKGKRGAVGSITKRVVGQLVGHAKGALRRGPTPLKGAACNGETSVQATPPGAAMPGGAAGGRLEAPRTRRPGLSVLLTGVWP